MDLFNRISEDEKDMIVHQIVSYADNCNGSMEKLSYILREWDRAKSCYLADMFGDELILSKDIEFHKDIDELECELESAYDEMRPRFMHQLEMIFYFNSWNRDWNAYREFGEQVSIPQCILDCPDERRADMYAAIGELTNIRCLCENVYRGKTIEFPTPAGKALKVNNGCRATKMLGKLVDAFGLDKEEFEAFRIRHSQVLNQKATKGRLCLSIHPLDFITMSDNKSGWSSCMSWRESGCYRQGTVEMMNSPCVVVAYLRSDEDMRINGHHWDNKKWRELYIITHEMITNVKGYPYCNSHLTGVVLDWLRELATNAGIGKYRAEVRNHEDGWFSDHGISFEFSTDKMYNDFGHDHQYCVVNTSLKNRDLYIHYSGASECMICGELNPDFMDQDEAQDLVCECCSGAKVCDCCGRVIRDDDYYVFDYEVICRDCHDEYYVMDAFTEEDRHRDDMVNIRICSDDRKKVLSGWRYNIWVDPENPKINTLSVDGEFVEFPYRHEKFIPISNVTDKFIEYLDIYEGVDKESLFRIVTRDSNWSEA